MVKRMMAVKLRSQPAKSITIQILLTVCWLSLSRSVRKTFDQFVQKELFRPAGMMQTSYKTDQPESNKRLCKYLRWKQNAAMCQGTKTFARRTELERAR
jgi:hypothetical protein